MGRENSSRFKYRAVSYGGTCDEMLHSLLELVVDIEEGDSSTKSVLQNRSQYASSLNVSKSSRNIQQSNLSDNAKLVVTDFLKGKMCLGKKKFIHLRTYTVLKNTFPSNLCV
eukprot:TRINITY_DN3788_c0_g1_i1.p1 TRINITY_DN3788_c0_g1~~TRINITY_DN3788_c0_g1_i1.p1  ORF type:complete len:112 (+),score=4.12 TRINITY_DN3788_c0_g1_i1:44-379(+)